jgi:transposase
VKRRIKATDIYIALESAGSYSENLYLHLIEDFKNVVVIPPLGVFNNRKQKSLHGLKSDDVDCGAIGDLLIRGEFTQATKESFVYYKLKNLVYWRERKIVMLVMMKHQIAHRINRCFPGLNCDWEDNKPIFRYPFTNHLYQGVMNNNMTVTQYLETNDETLYKKFNYPEGYIKRKYRIKQFKNRLNEMLMPKEEVAKSNLELLSLDVKLYKNLENEIHNVEESIIELGKKTPAVYLMGQIKGISDLYVSMYVGLIGDYRKYNSAKSIFSLSGLSPAISQSGLSPMNRSKGIKRFGNKMLRSLLFNMSRLVILSDPYFRNFYNKNKNEKKRNWKVNLISVSRKLNNILFALMRDKTQYRRAVA